MGDSTFAVVAALLLCSTLCNSQELPPSTIPQDTRIVFSAAYKTSYNGLANQSIRMFPSASSIPQVDYEYFSEHMDFDTIENYILLGAADKLYLLNSDLEAEALTWPPLEERRESCVNRITNSQLHHYICRNHIRLYQRHPTEPDVLFVCGTQADTNEQCRRLAIVDDNSFGNASIPKDASEGVDIISTHPDHPSFADFRELTPFDSSLISWTYRRVGTNLPFQFNEQTIGDDGQGALNNTETFTYKSGWFKNPAYIVDMFPISYSLQDFDSPPDPIEGQNYDVFYVFLREVHQFAPAPPLPGPVNQDYEQVILSQVVRICRDDPGVLLVDGTQAFSTLLKARIYCEQEQRLDNPYGAVDQRFNDLWSVALNGDGGRVTNSPGQNNYRYRRLMYGAFSNPLTAPAASAICVYPANPTSGEDNTNRGLFDTFIEDVNIGSSTENRENVYSYCDGTGRPALVQPNNQISAEDFLISQTMVQIGRDPLIVLDGVYITQMAVDEVCIVVGSSRESCLNQDVIFAGTDDGTILKIVMTVKGNALIPIVAEEISLDDSNYIRDMNIKVVGEEKYIFATTSSHVYRLPLERCARHVGLRECVTSLDPYCVWNTTAELCQRTSLSADGMNPGQVPVNILQNIHFGFISNLPSVGFQVSSYTVSERESEIVVTVTSNDTVPDGWVELVSITSDGVISGTKDPLPVVFTNFSATVSVPVASDSVYTGVEDFTIVIRNTDQGSTLLDRPQASIRVIDDDGILAQIGLAGLDDMCLQWRSKQVPLTLLDEAIKKGLIPQSLNVTVDGRGISCNPSQAVLNSAIYRFILREDKPNIDTDRLQSALVNWISKEEEVKLDGFTVKVDATCNPRILTLDDPPCSFGQVVSGLSPQSGVASAGGAAALSLGILLAIAIVACVVLLVALVIVKRQNSVHNHPQSPTANGSNKPNSDPTHDSLEDGEVPKCDLSSSNHASTPSPTSPDVPLNSAAPLMFDGVETKKSPFFTLQNPPFARRDSPRNTDSPRRSRVDSNNSVPTSHRNSRDDTAL